MFSRINWFSVWNRTENCFSCNFTRKLVLRRFGVFLQTNYTSDLNKRMFFFVLQRYYVDFSFRASGNVGSVSVVFGFIFRVVLREQRFAVWNHTEKQIFMRNHTQHRFSYDFKRKFVFRVISRGNCFDASFFLFGIRSSFHFTRTLLFRCLIVSCSKFVFCVNSRGK